MPSLLIVGGLTIDRFPDGTSAPGGSVIHAGRAAAGLGRIEILTVAGPEPEAADGLDRLAGLGAVHRQDSPRTVAYRHEEVDGRRELVLEAASDAIRVPDAGTVDRADVVLFAPIADELPLATMDALRAGIAPRVAVLLIQGWLRQLRIGHAVAPHRLESVPPEAWEAFGTADAVVVSTEDLASGPADPFEQAGQLRERLGPHPILVLTLGTQGYVLDDPAADRVVASVPRRVVDGVPTVGAGDTFGAALAIALADGASALDAAEAATERVIAVLEGRRPAAEPPQAT